MIALRNHAQQHDQSGLDGRSARGRVLRLPPEGDDQDQQGRQDDRLFRSAQHHDEWQGPDAQHAVGHRADIFAPRFVWLQLPQQYPEQSEPSQCAENARQPDKSRRCERRVGGGAEPAHRPHVENGGGNRVRPANIAEQAVYPVDPGPLEETPAGFVRVDRHEHPHEHGQHHAACCQCQQDAGRGQRREALARRHLVSPRDGRPVRRRDSSCGAASSPCAAGPRQSRSRYRAVGPSTGCKACRHTRQ